MSSSRLAELDLFRLFAALMVVCTHYFSGITAQDRMSLEYGAIFRYSPTVERYATLGMLGVNVFFVISGFVIALSAEGRSARDFLVSRLVRILPAFWLCCLLTYFAIWLDPSYRQVSSIQLLANMTFLARPLGYEFLDGVYWSLVVELLFYLLVAVLILTGWFRRFDLFLAGWLVLAWAEQFGIVPRLLKLLFLPQFAHYFVLGGALYLLHQGQKRRTAWALFAMSLVLAAWDSYGHLEVTKGGTGLGPFAAGVVVLSVLMLLMVTTSRGHSFAKPWMPAVGALTYPLYLLHEDLGFLFMRHLSWTQNPLIVTLSVVLLFLLLAHLVARYFERPAGAYLRRKLLGSTSLSRAQHA